MSVFLAGLWLLKVPGQVHGVPWLLQRLKSHVAQGRSSNCICRKDRWMDGRMDKWRALGGTIGGRKKLTGSRGTGDSGSD